MKIYVASSWRNLLQPVIVAALRGWNHEVYDFRNPPSRSGFGWEQVMKRDPDGKCSAEVWKTALEHPIAREGYASDLNALRWCEAVVYVLPCGRSASWELGYAMGQGKRAFVVALEHVEPELMFSEATIIGEWAHLRAVFAPVDDVIRAAGLVASRETFCAQPIGYLRARCGLPVGHAGYCSPLGLLSSELAFLTAGIVR